MYKEVNYSTSARDIRAGPPHYNYYISDRDSISEHIYEVIDDELIKHKHPGPPTVHQTKPVQCLSPPKPTDPARAHNSCPQTG